MKILALQLKRIGDLILTTPALAALRRDFPSAQVTLIVADACGELLPAIESVDQGLVFLRGRWNASLCKQIAFQRFDVCLDFTGNDRSAFLAALSRAPRRGSSRSASRPRWGPCCRPSAATSASSPSCMCARRPGWGPRRRESRRHLAGTRGTRTPVRALTLDGWRRRGPG